MKYIICFSKSQYSNVLRCIWYYDFILIISPTSFWLWSSTPLIIPDHRWFWSSSCTLSTHFLSDVPRTLAISQWLMYLLSFLGYTFQGMNNTLKLMTVSTLRCQVVFLSKSWAMPQKVGGHKRKRKNSCPKENLIIKKWIFFLSIQNIPWKCGLCLETLYLYSICCISGSISALILWAPLIHQMGF